MPVISIIIPVFNTEQYLPACLDSILAQTFKDFEAILVDDGSSDQSGKICDDYAAKDSRFVVTHKKNEGVAKARMTAFEISRGELITFIDSDDYVSPYYLEILSAPILKDHADIVSCDLHIDKNGTIKDPHQKLTGIYEKTSLRTFLSDHYLYDPKCNYGMSVFLWSKMIRRHLVHDGLQTGLGMWFGEDQVGVFQMLLQCEKLVLIPDRLYYYVEREGQASMKYDSSLWDSMFLMFQTYQRLDTEKIVQEGLRKRTWVSVNYSIFHKMAKAGISKHLFCSDLKKIRNHPYMRTFFRPWTLGFGKKAALKYWLLKLRLYTFFYNIFVKHHSN